MTEGIAFRASQARPLNKDPIRILGARAKNRSAPTSCAAAQPLAPPGTDGMDLSTGGVEGAVERRESKAMAAVCGGFFLFFFLKEIEGKKDRGLDWEAIVGG